MSIAEKALQEWIKTQSLPVSDVEEHGFINGYNWATAKTLTDEEIISCIDESEPDTTDMIRFARAILRKAQEK